MGGLRVGSGWVDGVVAAFDLLTLVHAFFTVLTNVARVFIAVRLFCAHVKDMGICLLIRPMPMSFTCVNFIEESGLTPYESESLPPSIFP